MEKKGAHILPIVNDLPYGSVALKLLLFASDYSTLHLVVNMVNMHSIFATGHQVSNQLMSILFSEV